MPSGGSGSFPPCNSTLLYRAASTWEYIAEDGKSIAQSWCTVLFFGSVERFFGILLEHYAGAYPLWLAPVQAVVMAITDRQGEYARGVAAQLTAAGLRVNLDDRSEKIN